MFVTNWHIWAGRLYYENDITDFSAFAQLTNKNIEMNYKWYVGLMKVAFVNLKTDVLLVRSGPQLSSSSCDWSYLHYTFLLCPHTSQAFPVEAEEPQAWYDLSPLADLWALTWLTSFASLIYDSNFSLTQCNLNSNFFKEPVSHDSRTDRPCFTASAFASHTELSCRTFQKTWTSSGNVCTEVTWGFWCLLSHLTQHLWQTENVESLFGHYRPKQTPFFEHFQFGHRKGCN